MKEWVDTIAVFILVGLLITSSLALISVLFVTHPYYLLFIMIVLSIIWLSLRYKHII